MFILYSIVIWSLDIINDYWIVAFLTEYYFYYFNTFVFDLHYKIVSFVYCSTTYYLYSKRSKILRGLLSIHYLTVMSLFTCEQWNWSSQYRTNLISGSMIINLSIDLAKMCILYLLLDVIWWCLTKFVPKDYTLGQQ